MDRSALDWIFSTAPQAIAALVGLILAGVSILIGRLENMSDRDETLTDITKEIEKGTYYGMIWLLSLSCVVISIDLACLYFNPIKLDDIICLLGISCKYCAIVIIAMAANFLIFLKSATTRII